MTFRRLVISGMAAACVALLAAPVAAQPPPDQRGYITAFGGATFTEVNDALFGGAVGINIGRNVQVFGEVARMQNIEAPFSREDLAGLQDASGGTLVVSAEMPALYGVGGVRVLMPAAGQVRPYVLASAGVVHLSPKPSFVFQGVDITSAVMQEDVFQTAFKNSNRPIASAGAGVQFQVVQHVSFDLGYKYSRIFIPKDYLQEPPPTAHQHNGINVHRFYVGAGYVF